MQDFDIKKLNREPSDLIATVSAVEEVSDTRNHSENFHNAFVNSGEKIITDCLIVFPQHSKCF